MDAVLVEGDSDYRKNFPEEASKREATDREKTLEQKGLKLHPIFNLFGGGLNQWNPMVVGKDKKGIHNILENILASSKKDNQSFYCLLGWSNESWALVIKPSGKIYICDSHGKPFTDNKAFVATFNHADKVTSFIYDDSTLKANNNANEDVPEWQMVNSYIYFYWLQTPENER